MAGGRKNRLAGDRFERLVVDELRRCGYLVFRAGGSLGPFDVVALRLTPERPLAVSCKTNGRQANAERVALSVLARRYGALPLLAFKSDRPGQIIYTHLDSRAVWSPFEHGK